MNYEDEDYVRYYTRDTVSWMALGWEGQAVLALMLHGKFDRSGVFDCDGHTPSHAVTLVTRLPEEITKVGLKALLDSKTWVHRDGKLVWPKFVHAQSCRRTDKARQRESREKRRSEAMGTEPPAGDDPSQPVTLGHTESQPVTPSLAEQSRAEDPPTPLPAVTEIRPKPRDRMAESLTGRAPKQRADVQALFAEFCELYGFTGAVLGLGAYNLDPETLAECIDARGMADCRLVLKHSPNDGMVSGRDDERKQKHQTIRYIFGNQDAFNRILRAARVAESSAPGSVADQMRKAAEAQP